MSKTWDRTLTTLVNALRPSEATTNGVNGATMSDTLATALDTSLFGHTASRQIVVAIESEAAPFTVDAATDRVSRVMSSRDQPSDLEQWGDLHEALYHDVLPALDKAGRIRFNPDQGVIYQGRGIG